VRAKRARRHAPLAAHVAPVVEDVQEHAFCLREIIHLRYIYIHQLLSEAVYGPIDLSDTSWKLRKWDSALAYAESKLANVLFAKVYIRI